MLKILTLLCHFYAYLLIALLYKVKSTRLKCIMRITEASCWQIDCRQNCYIFSTYCFLRLYPLFQEMWFDNLRKLFSIYLQKCQTDFRYYIQYGNGQAEHVDKKTTPEQPVKQVSAPINRIPGHPDKKRAPNNRNPELPDKT